MDKQMVKKIVPLAVIAVLLLAGAVWSFTRDGAPQGAGTSAGTAADTSSGSTSGTAAEAGYDKGNALPDFTADLVSGDKFTLSEHSGKIVFINLFATWCSPCMNEMPDIQKLYEECGDKVDFVAIDVGDSAETAADFAKNSGYTFPIASSEDGAMGDYKVRSIPQTFIVDEDGVIVFYSGQRSTYEAFSAAVEGALG